MSEPSSYATTAYSLQGGLQFFAPIDSASTPFGSYNGTPRGLTNCNEGGCPVCNGSSFGDSDPDECVCLHAEENALLEAGRERVGSRAVLYCNTLSIMTLPSFHVSSTIIYRCPCLKCTVKIIQTGITSVVYSLSYKVCVVTVIPLYDMNDCCTGMRLQRDYSKPLGSNCDNTVCPRNTNVRIFISTNRISFTAAMIYLSPRESMPH